MDTRPVDYLRHRMARFSAAIDETRTHFSDLSAFGKYPASAPYYEKSGILPLLESLNADPGTREELTTEFRAINRKLSALEEELGETYRQKLSDELLACVDIYAAAVCHANLGGLSFESDHELFRRDRVTVLVHELEKDHDLTGIKNLIRQMDTNLFPATGYPGAGSPDPLPGTVETTRSRKSGDRIES